MAGMGKGQGQAHATFRRGTWVLTALLCAAALPARAEAPARVVSMNLCTDQLAMLLAAPGQLLSVSHLAAEPQSSPMVAEAAAYEQNRGGAEQIYLMKPDLVLAGTYTSLASFEVLRSLGIRVVQVPPVTSVKEVTEQMLLVGQLLGRDEAAAAMVAGFEADLADLAYAGDPATAVLYYPNGYTTGAGTLADDVLAHAGFRNIGAAAGLTGGGTLPLERLVLAAPQVVVTSTPYPGASRAEEIMAHPALVAVRAASGATVYTDADWVCGTPYLLRAMKKMKIAREAIE